MYECLVVWGPGMSKMCFYWGGGVQGSQMYGAETLVHF